MNRRTGRGVLVGVDGAADGLRAAVWGARDAVRRGAPLTVAHVRESLPPVYPEFAAQVRAELAATATAAVDAAEAAALEAAPGLSVRKVVVDGAPAEALVGLAADADLVVVGSRGHGTFARLLLGSVADRVARHAPVTVVVVRAEEPDGPVVAGVDLDSDSGAVLAFAAEQAVARGALLVAVHATPTPPGYLPTIGAPPDFWPEDQEKYAAEALQRAVEPLTASYPQLRLKPVVLPGSAARNLVGSSEAAALVVVGATGSGAFDGLRLGSVGSHLLHHARCPVAVVRA